MKTEQMITKRFEEIEKVAESIKKEIEKYYTKKKIVWEMKEFDFAVRSAMVAGLENWIEEQNAKLKGIEKELTILSWVLR